MSQGHDMKEPIRVLHVIGSMNRGGAEAMIMNLYRNIDRSKVQFDFLVHTTEKAAYDDEILALGGRIYHIIAFTGVNVRHYYRECDRFFEEHPEFSVVHGHIGSSATFYLKAAKRHGIFTIAHSHNTKAGDRSLHSLAYSLYSYPVRYIADFLFGCSTEAGRDRYGKKKVRTPKYKTFPNAIETAMFLFDPVIRGELRTQFGFGERDFVIGTVGRITAQKNPDFIYTLFEKIVSTDSGFKCVWVGTGEREAECREKLRHSGFGDKVIMTGLRSDVNELLQAFDCFVLPSLYEGLPVVAIEAQTAGLPCLLANTISRESEVSHLVQWLPIDRGVDVWADKIMELKFSSPKRESPLDEIKKAGYDICETANWLCSFYLEHQIKDER